MKSNGTRITLLVMLLMIAAADYYLFQNEKPVAKTPVVSGSDHLFVSLMAK